MNRRAFIASLVGGLLLVGAAVRTWPFRVYSFPTEFRASAQEQQPRTFRIPFHSVNGMVLLDAEVNGKPAVLLLDTGADFTLISPQASGLSKARLRALTATQTTGANGEYVKARVDLKLAEQRWVDRAVLVMDLSEASKRLGTRIDGFVGADLLQEFSAVRIDFKNHLVELESER